MPNPTNDLQTIFAAIRANARLADLAGENLLADELRHLIVSHQDIVQRHNRRVARQTNHLEVGMRVLYLNFENVTILRFAPAGRVVIDLHETRHPIRSVEPRSLRLHD